MSLRHHLERLLPLLLVILTTGGVISYLVQSLSQIQETLPPASLHLGRDFSALNLDVERLYSAHQRYAIDPGEQAREQLVFAHDMVVLRLRDNRSLYSGTNQKVDAMQQVIEQLVTEMDHWLSAPQPAPGALRASLEMLGQIRIDLQALNDDIFQSSMQQAGAQQERITGFRDAITLLISFVGLAAVILLLLHYQNQRRLRDIRRSEARLHASEEKLRTLYELSPIGIVLTDLEGRYLEFNPAFSRLCGYSPEELRGMDCWTLTPSDYAEQEIGLHNELVRHGRYGPYEKEYLHKDGRRIPVCLNGVIVSAPDGSPLVWSLVEDISTRKLQDAELARYREHLEDTVQARTAALIEAKANAEAASRAKSAFLANMSHELRTPMHGVMGMIEMAKRHMHDPKGQTQLDKARQSAERLLGVLNDILDLTKIEAERMVLEDLPLQLALSVDNVIGVLEHKATQKGLKLTVDLPADLAWRPLKGDPLRLGQILMNLAGNAIKFTEQGEVVLRAYPVGETATALPVQFEVADTGIGIAPEAQLRLFNSFAQADDSMTRKYGGTGLGLAISKRLVQLMGGEIGVDSSAGQGSTFWFVVPFKKPEHCVDLPATTDDPPSAAESLLQAHANAAILLVEDEPISQEVTRGLLEDVGLRVDVAENGQVALALAHQKHYAVILMDMQMPVMNGLDATKAIRADSKNRTTPILAMTANAFAEDRAACLTAGMSEHLVKPVDPDKLYETLLMWLKNGNQ